MRNFFIGLFIVVAVFVGVLTFLPQPKFPAVNTSFATAAAVMNNR